MPGIGHWIELWRPVGPGVIYPCRAEKRLVSPVASVSIGRMDTDSPTGSVSLAVMRKDYSRPALRREDLHADPVVQFERWLGEAVNEGIVEPNAMTLSTVDEHGEAVGDAARAVDEVGRVEMVLEVHDDAPCSPMSRRLGMILIDVNAGRGRPVCPRRAPAGSQADGSLGRSPLHRTVCPKRAPGWSRADRFGGGGTGVSGRRERR